jgi:hypothetical protein
MEGQPSDKSPGYYRVSLRDEVKTGFQMSKCKALRGADSLAERIPGLYPGLPWVNFSNRMGPEGDAPYGENWPPMEAVRIPPLEPLQLQGQKRFFE